MRSAAFACYDHTVGQYLRRYVLAPGSEAAYRDMVGADRLAALGEWSISDERWLELLS